jgi:glutamate-ammonia-ligase adenylyltransferase
VREILTEFIPHILQSFANSNNPDEALFKFDDFLEQIPNGVLLFSLLEEKPALIDLLAEIMGNSPWLANNFSRSPSLINHILTIDFYTDLPSPSELRKEIRSLLHDVKEEEKISIIRRWKHDKEFQVGIRLLKNIISHDMAAEYLSSIAEIIISKIFSLVDEDKTKGQLAIIAMGKLGLRDLTFGSDLDLVFVYESEDQEAASYYTKIVNRFIQAITSMSNEGMLYNIDTRLRPMGDKGAIGCSLEAYERYYHESAWNWELMALTKGRVIFGEELGIKVSKIIALIISEDRDAKTLADDMHKMRLKIAESYPDNDIWDVKYARGGLFEAEFVLQFRTLTAQNPAPESVAQDFAECYNLLRDVQSAIRLTIGAEEFDETLATENQKKILTKSVGESSFESMKSKLIDAQGKIHEYYNKTFNMGNL